MGLVEGQLSNLQQSSPDIGLLSSIRRYKNVLEEANSQYTVIGSVGLQAHLRTYQRRPRDMDVLVSEVAIRSLRSVAASRGLDFLDDPVACSIDDGSGLRLHLIPHAMRWVDRKTRAVFARPLLYFPDHVVSKKFSSIVTGEEIQLPVPIAEFSVGMNLVPPMSSELLSVLVAVASNTHLDAARVAEFFARVPEFSEIGRARLTQLTQVAGEGSRPGCAIWEEILDSMP